MGEAFAPAWWCRNAHAQTLWPRIAPGPVPALRRERVELPDGDFIDLDWTLNRTGPVVLVLHGLEGSSRSPYARGLLQAVQGRGWRGVVMHFRGCSGEPNRLPRSYHSGDTGDLDAVVRLLRQREPQTPLAVAGYSVGGNVLLKWLGEQGSHAPVAGAVAVSVPFELGKAVDVLHRSLFRVYENYFLRSLVPKIRQKLACMELPVRARDLGGVRSLRRFDDVVTAPLHGFASAEDYYTRSSCRGFLPGIRTPTLILHARDDPFMPPTVIPRAGELPAAVALEAHDHGGHVGFVAGRWPGKPRYWLEQRIPDYLRASLEG